MTFEKLNILSKKLSNIMGNEKVRRQLPNLGGNTRVVSAKVKKKKSKVSISILFEIKLLA